MRLLLALFLLAFSTPTYSQKTADEVYKQIFLLGESFNGYVPYTDIMSQKVKKISISISPLDTLQKAMVTEEAYWCDSLGMPFGNYSKLNEKIFQEDSLLPLEHTTFYEYNSDALKALSIVLNYLGKSESDSLFCDSLFTINTGSIILEKASQNKKALRGKKASRDKNKTIVSIDIGRGLSIKLFIVRPYYLERIEAVHQDIGSSTMYLDTQKQLVKIDTDWHNQTCGSYWKSWYYSFSSSGLLYKLSYPNGDGPTFIYDEFSRLVSDGDEKYVYPNEKTRLPAYIYYNNYGNEWEYKLAYELREP